MCVLDVWEGAVCVTSFLPELGRSETMTASHAGLVTVTHGASPVLPPDLVCSSRRNFSKGNSSKMALCVEAVSLANSSSLSRGPRARPVSEEAASLQGLLWAPALGSASGAPGAPADAGGGDRRGRAGAEARGAFFWSLWRQEPLGGDTVAACAACRSPYTETFTST